MTPEQAVALACAALGADAAAATVLRAADAITVQLDERRVARVIPGTDAETRRVLAAIGELDGHVLEPLGAAVELDGALVVPYPRITPDGDTHRDLGIAGACLAGLHARGRAALERGIDLPDFAPHAIAVRWLDRADAVFTADERSRLLDAIDTAWPEVAGPRTVIHGDAHLGNWWPARDDWWVLIDPEFLSVGPAVYDLAPLEVVERRLGTPPSRFPSFLAGYESADGAVDRRSLASAIHVRELLSVAWLASRSGDDAERALRTRRRLVDALERREGSWLA
ncbi:MAG: phosphotransferase [Gaiellales bacterium]